MLRAIRLRRELIELQHRLAHAQQLGGHDGPFPAGTSRGGDRLAVAGLDAPFIHQIATHANERGAGGQIGGEISRLHAAGRAERDLGKHADQRFDVAGAADR